jgi:RimJ/RimL family protein N-acetyltransferase
MWIALDSDRVLARVAWWGQSDDDVPSALDILDVDDGDERIDHEDLCFTLLEIATATVITEGSRRPDYGRFVPPDWRDHPETSKPVEVRMAALERAGAHLLVERLRFELTEPSPIAERTDRLSFRPPRDDGELVQLMTVALEGTLDVHSQLDLSAMSAHDAAVRHFECELVRYQSPHDWWRVATLPGGDPVGFVIPARNDYHAIIAYIAVLPHHRGRGHIDEVLSEGTRVLHAQQVPRIRASTDLGNVPMANAFTRAGWRNFERSIDMTW